MPLLPIVQLDIVEPLFYDVEETKKVGGNYSDKILKILKDENPVLWVIVSKMACDNEEELAKKFLKGALMTYQLLRQQAEADDLKKRYG